MRSVRRVLGVVLVVLAVGACGRGQPTGSARIGIESPWSVTYLPTAVAIDRLKEKGIQLEPVLFESPETMTQALQTDQIHIGSTSAGTVFAAIEAGLPARAFLGLNRNNFVMVARARYRTCAALDGKRVGIHSRQGTTGTLTAFWFERECPAARPNIIVVPGSENRIAGLLANQLDATAVDIPSAVQLLRQHPQDFVTIESFEALDIVASLFYAKRAWLEANRALVQAFVDTYRAVVEEASRDPAPLLAKGRELIPEMDAQVLEEVVRAWIARGIWAPVAALDDQAITTTLNFHRRGGGYTKITGPADVVDASFVRR